MDTSKLTFEGHDGMIEALQKLLTGLSPENDAIQLTMSIETASHFLEALILVKELVDMASQDDPPEPDRVQ